MSPAAPVGLLTHGEARWFSQRPKPYTNCMFAAVCVPLSFMGYDLPDDFVQRLRDASGVDKDKPTSTADTRRALKKLIPDCPIQFTAMDETSMLSRIAAGEIVVRVMVRVGPDLDPELKKHFRPSFEGKHAVALAEATPLPGGDFRVLWLDPMGRPKPGYSGTHIEFSRFRDALVRTEGKVQVAFGQKDAALPEKPDEVIRTGKGALAGNMLAQPVPDGPVVLTRYRPDEFAHVDAGTAFLHPTTLEVVTRAQGADDFRLAGRSTDGKFAGVWVNTRRIHGARGMTLLLVDREQIGPPFIDQ